VGLATYANVSVNEKDIVMKLSLILISISVIVFIIILNKRGLMKQSHNSSVRDEHSLPDVDKIWNRACENEFPTPKIGDKALSDLLQFHGLSMNGGLHHGAECLTKSELEEAVAGYNYFELSTFEPIIRAVIEEVEKDIFDESIEYDLQYDDGNIDQVIFDAFKDDFEKQPNNYASVIAN
jgi:hypothetical protein